MIGPNSQDFPGCQCDESPGQVASLTCLHLPAFCLDEYVVGKIAVASARGLIVPRSADSAPEQITMFSLPSKTVTPKNASVQVGLANEKEVEVNAQRSSAGEPVVTLGNYELKDGMAVKVDASR